MSDEEWALRARALLKRLKKAESSSRTEEDLRIRVEHILRESIPELPEPRYEKSIQTATYLGRADAVHARLVIEYESPRKMKGAKTDHAVRQLYDYLSGLAIDGGLDEDAPTSREQEERLAATVGIAFDGRSIVFVQRRFRSWHADVRTLDLESVERLLLWFRATARKDLSASNLIEDFGPATELSSSVVSALADLVASGKHPKATVVYEEWRRLFGVVYGTEQLKRTSNAAETKSLKTAYHLELPEVDFPLLLFSIHTYYALLMKMLATELIVAQGAFADSFIGNLTRSSLRTNLEELESGELLQARNVRNVVEQDFFGWYVSAWTRELGNTLWGMASALSVYDVATFELKPSRARDLLKDLYMGLIPETVRHALGEYYTPDWLAEHTVHLSGYQGDPRSGFLDPACGSGTFLVMAIQAVRDWLNDHSPEWTTAEKRREALELVQRNVVGFDLNPLTVIASRTNYLFALGPLLRYHTGKKPLEIPVYLTDSVLLPGQVETQPDMFAKNTVSFPMTVGTFEVPREVVERELVPALMTLLHEAIVEKHTEKAFVTRATGSLGLSNDDDTVHSLAGLFNSMVKLDSEGRNRIWTKLIQNRYASLLFKKHFDYVVGNPPHVNWEYLTPEWRKAAEKEYQRYGLFTLSGLASQHGGGKKDIAALFTYAVLDHFVKDGAVMALIVHVSLFKTTGAGEGYRRFQLGDKEHFKIDEVHDFSSFQPFMNQTRDENQDSNCDLCGDEGKGNRIPDSLYGVDKD